MCTRGRNIIPADAREVYEHKHASFCRITFGTGARRSRTLPIKGVFALFEVVDCTTSMTGTQQVAADYWH